MPSSDDSPILQHMHGMFLHIFFYFLSSLIISECFSHHYVRICCTWDWFLFPNLYVQFKYLV